MEKLALNEDQIKAVKTVKGNLLILASAGTGKTTTIVERYVNLVENCGLKPEEIMMTTFTNKAAKDMVRKIERRTKKIPTYIGTMHSLFLKILRKNYSWIGFKENFTLLTEDKDKKKIIKRLMIEKNIKPENENIIYFVKRIEKFKNRGIVASDLEEYPDFEDSQSNRFIEEEVEGGEFITIPEEIKKLSNHIYIKYQEILKNNNMVDFDDILLYTFDLFRKNDFLLNSYKNRLKIIMVDEAQDLNVVQRNILELLQNNNLCLIGDDCQNIYSWRGSSNELIFNFDEKHEKIVLKDNYRSTEEIISNVNNIIDSINFKIDKKLQCTRDKGKKIVVENFADINEEIYSIAYKIKKLLKKGEKPEDVAVLFRTNNIGKQIERIFRKEKIPCHLSRSTSFFKREEIKDILSFLKLKINPSSELEFERVIRMISGVGKSKVDKIKEISEETNVPFGIALGQLENTGFNQGIKKKLVLFNNMLRNENQNPIELFLSFFEYEKNMNDKYVEDPEKIEDKIENIKVLKEIFLDYDSSFEGLRNFLDDLIDLEKREKDRDKVTLSTIHSSKGLEWKYVYLACCNETILPSYKGYLSKIKKDDELRLFYVAVSRTKDFLNISNSENHKWRDLEPSQFLEIIDAEGNNFNNFYRRNRKNLRDSEEINSFNDDKISWSENEFVPADEID